MTTKGPLQALLVLLAIAPAWIVLAAAVAWLRTEPRIVAMMGPPERGMQVLAAANQTVVAAGPWAVTTRIQDAEGVRRLYASGAWLVVEGNAGCNWFSLPKS